ncbi:MAG: histidine kinase [Cyclobacteriaceae bacterium]
MRHPIFELAGRLYGITWIVIAMVQVVLFNLYYGIELVIAITDSVIFNAMFMGLGIGFWYIVRFSQTDNRDIGGLITLHLTAALLTVATWTYGGTTLLGIIFRNEIYYIDFLETSIAGRGMVGMLYYVVLTLVYYLIQYNIDLQQKLHEELELKSIIQETELRALKSQINPHFIFNSLNSISSLTITAPEKARNMVIKLSDFLRYSLGQDAEELNSLQEEITQSQRYMDIEKVRFGDKLVFRCEVDDTLLKCAVPKMILQPLFENAIKYGVYESIAPVTIVLTGEQKGDLLILRMSNNFDSESVVKKGEGIGLKNIQQRLNIHFSSAGLLSTKVDENVFIVEMKIPQQHDQSHHH